MGAEAGRPCVFKNEALGKRGEVVCFDVSAFRGFGC